MNSDALSDLDLEKKLDTLRSAIQEWMVAHEFSSDWGFKTWQEHYDDEPGENPCVLILWHENELTHSPDLQYELSKKVTEPLGFFAEAQSNTIIGFFMNEDGNEALTEAFRNYFEWKWLTTLIEASYFDLHGEIFEYASRNPDRLHGVTPRAFEKFLDAVFKNNGYRTVLGPGRGDGGVDLRLYHNDVVGEVTTLVQAKRYASHRSIGLEAVQALAANVDDARANRGLFVTTSRYLPGVRDFAQRQNNKLILADALNISTWAERACLAVERNKAKWVAREHVLERLANARKSPSAGTVFVAEVGVTISMHVYALLLQQVGDVALFLRLPRTEVTDGWVGTDLPLLEDSAAEYLNTEGAVFRARKYKDDSNCLSYWGDRSLWSAHDGSPQYFDHLD